MRAVPRSTAVIVVAVVALAALAYVATPRGVPGLLIDLPATTHPAPPELKLVSPRPGEGVAGSVRIVGEALAREGDVDAVEVRVDGGLWRDVTLAPGLAASTFSLELPLAAGDHLVEARARDGNASSVLARALVRSAAVAPATLRIHSPPDGQGVAAGDVLVTGTLVGDAPVVVAAGGPPVAARVLPGGLWEATVRVPPGEHVLEARTQGPRAGLPAKARVLAGEVAPPTLAVASPRPGAAFGSAGDLACADACILFAGTVDASATGVLAFLDGERAPGSDPLLVGGAWTYKLPMSRLYAGEHDVSFVPLSGETRGLAQHVDIAVRTPKVVQVTGDLAPEPTLTPLSFNATVASGMRVRWSVDGVRVAEGASATITFSRPGAHDVRIEAVDAQGRAADVLHTLVALDRPPQVSLGAAVEGAVAALDASATDADGVVVEYAWEFGDGETESTFLPQVRHRYPRAGAYRANVTAIDEQGARSAPASVLVQVLHDAPGVRFEWAPYEPSILDTVVFRDVTSDADHRIVQRSWDFGDGGADTAVARHAFATRGDHPVTLRVVDVDGVDATITQVVRVRDLPPVARFLVEPALPRTGQPVLFADRSTDADGPVVAWAWDFGDGGNGTGAAVTHTFGASGEHLVRLRVTDDMGEVGEVVVPVLVQDVEPDLRDLRIEPERPRARDEVRFSAVPVDPEGIVTLGWDFGDGTNAQGTEVVHRFPRSGIYHVNVTVLDGAGQTRSRVFPLEVGNAPPFVALEPPELVYAAFRTVFEADAQDADGHLVSYAFDLDGDGLSDCAGDAPSCTYVYERPGTYIAAVRVMDDEGGRTESSRVVDVLMPPAGLAPPRVAIELPQPEATVRGVLRASGAVIGPRPIHVVEAQLREENWSLTPSMGRPWREAVGGDLWHLSLDTAGFEDGAYDLVVRATDDGGAQGLATMRVVLANGARESEVTLRILDAPEVLADRGLVRGSAYHPDGVTAVRWRLDEGPWTAIAGSSLAFEIPLDARSLPPGDHVVTVAAYHGVADKREVARVFTVPGAVPRLVVDLPPPEVAYGLLRAGGRILGEGEAQWRLDHGLWRTLPQGRVWLLDEETRAIANGPHTLQLRAVSPDGRLVGEPLSWRIDVVNPPPPAVKPSPTPLSPSQEVPLGPAWLVGGVLVGVALRTATTRGPRERDR